MEIGLLSAFLGGALALHTAALSTGIVIIAVGILFWATNGLATMPSLVPTRVLARWQEKAAVLSGTGIQITVILALGALALALWWRTDCRRRSPAAPRLCAGTEARRPGTGGRR